MAAIFFELERVATPEFSTAAGSYINSQIVSISCKTLDANIYYTTDGSTLTISSNKYSSPINVNFTMTIKAIAVKN